MDHPLGLQPALRCPIGAEEFGLLQHRFVDRVELVVCGVLLPDHGAPMQGETHRRAQHARAGRAYVAFKRPHLNPKIVKGSVASFTGANIQRKSISCTIMSPNGDDDRMKDLSQG